MPDLRVTRKRMKTALVVMAGVDLLAAILYFSPLVGSAETRRQDLNRLQTDLIIKTRQVAPLQNLPQKVVLANDEIVAFYKKRFPAQDSEIATEFGKLAAANGVTIEQAKYKRNEPGPGHLEPVEIEADLAGNYTSLARFINALERDDMFFIINSVTLGGQPQGPVKLNVKLEAYLKAGIVVQLGLENKKKTMWAAVLGVVALLASAYVFIPLFTGTSSAPASSAQAAAPVTPRANSRPGKAGKKHRVESLDPTLRLDLLAASEHTMYEGSGRNIFISQAEAIPQPKGPGVTDPKKAEDSMYHVPTLPPPPPIPLKFFGFASQPGEPKKIFLSEGEDVFVAGEGEIVNRRYKVIRIMPNSVEMQDVVNSGPTQNIPLTQG